MTDTELLYEALQRLEEAIEMCDELIRVADGYDPEVARRRAGIGQLIDDIHRQLKSKKRENRVVRFAHTLTPKRGAEIE